ncbi:MAG TPA: PIG-L family deacetylase, partial [Bryobacteraceae bacterium]|nr:PIG-L family deacetylase [Bryobacteraceae bacterium]
MIRWLARFHLLLVFPATAVHPDPWNEGAAAARHSIMRAANGVRVVHIVAHPDDEDAALLTALSRGLGYDVLLLSLSRGEGGANLTGPEMYAALGRIREEETLAAARHYGVRVRFASAVDFGFSKRLDETFEHWDRKALVDEEVSILREEEPHIIIARFHGS